MRHPREGSRHDHTIVDDFGADIISSPVARRRLRSDDVLTESHVMAPASVLVRRTPSPSPSDGMAGPDLHGVLSFVSTSKAGSYRPSIEPSNLGSTPPEDNSCPSADEVSEDENIDTGGRLRGSRVEIVTNGWWNKWAWKSEPGTGTKEKPMGFRRCETTVTPTGRQPGCHMPPTTSSPSNLCDGGRSTRDAFKLFQQKFSERASTFNPM